MSSGKTQGRGSGKSRYYYIYHGSCRRKVDESTPGAERRVKSTDAIIFELIDDWVKGKIVRIMIKKSDNADYKDSYIFVMVDEEGMFTLEISSGSGYLNNFLNKFRDVDFEKQVRLEPYYIKKEGEARAKSYMGVFQDDQSGQDWGAGFIEKKFLPFHTREEPNGVPEAIQDESTKKWDFNEQRKYLHKLFKDKIFPIIGQEDWWSTHESNDFKKLLDKYIPIKESPVAEEKKYEAAEIIEEEEDDQLPF